MDNIQYRHRQSSHRLVLFSTVGLTVLTVPNLLAGEYLAAAILLGVVAIVVVILTAFTALTTEVTDEHIRVAFRFGWPARTIPLSSITSHEPVRNRWWYGLGVRLIPGGWLYAVWGLDAVEIRYDDGHRGERTFRIGTDDETGLDAAIAARLRGDGRGRLRHR